MRLSKKKVEKIKAAIAEGMKQPRSPSGSRSAARMVSDIATGRVHKDVAWPDGEPPVPKRAGGQHKPIPDYDPTDKRIMELEAEVVHLTEERNRERQKVKAGAKSAGLFKAIVAEMEQRVKPFDALPPVSGLPPQGADHGALRHAPLRMATTIRSCGRRKSAGWRTTTSRSPAPAPSGYVDTVIEWTQDTLAPKFHFPVLWVLAYGDYTSGEIHKACERSYYRNQFRNCLAIGQLHALMYRDLAAHFEQVNVLYLAGNHGRRTPKKDYLGAHDNWDYLVAEIARLHCRDMENVQLPDSRCVVAPTSTSTASASTSRTATTCAATWASPGTAWSAGKRA